MAKYRVTLGDGRTFVVTADRPPSEADVLKALGGGGEPPPKEPAAPAPTAKPPVAPPRDPSKGYTSEEFTPKSFGGFVANAANDAGNVLRAMNPFNWGEGINAKAAGDDALLQQLRTEQQSPAAFQFPGDRLARQLQETPETLYREPVQAALAAAPLAKPLARTAGKYTPTVAAGARAVGRGAQAAAPHLAGAAAGYGMGGGFGLLAGAVAPEVVQTLRGRGVGKFIYDRLRGSVEPSAPSSQPAPPPWATPVPGGGPARRPVTPESGFREMSKQGRRNLEDITAADEMTAKMSQSSIEAELLAREQARVAEQAAVADARIAAGFEALGEQGAESFARSTARDRVAEGMSAAGRAAAEPPPPSPVDPVAAAMARASGIDPAKLKIAGGMSEAGQRAAAPPVPPPPVDPLAAAMARGATIDPAKLRIAGGMSEAGQRAASPNQGGTLAAPTTPADALAAALSKGEPPGVVQMPGTGKPPTLSPREAEAMAHLTQQLEAQQSNRFRMPQIKSGWRPPQQPAPVASHPQATPQKTQPSQPPPAQSSSGTGTGNIDPATATRMYRELQAKAPGRTSPEVYQSMQDDLWQASMSGPEDVSLLAQLQAALRERLGGMK